MVGELFSVFRAPVVQTTPVQAELAKIWTNILRYTHFALPNLLMMDCERAGANVFEVIELINRDYPRGGIAQPGLTAGTCLRKDFTFSEERSAAPGMLLAVSRVNESVPLFLVEGARRRLGRRIAGARHGARRTGRRASRNGVLVRPRATALSDLNLSCRGRTPDDPLPPLYWLTRRSRPASGPPGCCMRPPSSRPPRSIAA